MTQPPSRSSEDEIRYRIAHVDQAYGTLRRLIAWTGICVLGYFGKEAIVALAGHHTFADISLTLKWLVGEKKGVVFAWANAIGWGLYGFRQRKLRRDFIQKSTARMKQLELERDPGRTSSNLTDRGETNPEDKL